MRVPLPYFWPSLAVGAGLGWMWWRQDPAQARVAELEAQVRSAEQAVRVRTVLGAAPGPGLAAAPPPPGADPIPWAEPLRAPDPLDPIHEEASIRQVLAEVLDDPEGLVSLSCEPYPCRAVVIQRNPLDLRGELQSLGFTHVRIAPIRHLTTDGERSQRVFAPQAGLITFPAEEVTPAGEAFLRQLEQVSRIEGDRELRLRGQAFLDAAWEEAQRESP